MSALTRRKIASSSSSRSSCASSGSKASGSPGTSPNSRTGGWRSMIMAALPKLRGSGSHHHSRAKLLILHRKLVLGRPRREAAVEQALGGLDQRQVGGDRRDQEEVERGRRRDEAEEGAERGQRQGHADRDHGEREDG